MKLADFIEALPEGDRAELIKEVDEYRSAVHREAAQKNFIQFTKEMWAGFVDGRHHKVMAKQFERIAAGECK